MYVRPTPSSDGGTLSVCAKRYTAPIPLDICRDKKDGQSESARSGQTRMNCCAKEECREDVGT